LRTFANMKTKSLIYAILPLLFLIITTNKSLAQKNGNTTKTNEADSSKTDTLPYLKYPTIPAFNILLIDSTTIFNTYNIPSGKPTVLMFFDPDCKHCKATTRMICEKMDSLKDIQFYIFTARHDMSMIQNYYKKFHLADYPNIKAVGMDTEFFFFSYYGVHYVPDLAVYDENKKLIKLLDASCTVQDLYQLTHK